jgi:hypothetical protein
VPNSTVTLSVPSSITSSTSGGASTITVGSQTSPAAGTTITSQALAAGTYAVSWSVQLSGTVSASDVNNFGLYNGVTLVATSLNSGATSTYSQPNLTVVIPGGGATLAIKAIATATTGAVYNAQLTTTLNGSTTNTTTYNTVYVGQSSSVTSANGFPINPGGPQVNFSLPPTGAVVTLYAICASGATPSQLGVAVTSTS